MIDVCNPVSCQCFAEATEALIAPVPSLNRAWKTDLDVSDNNKIFSTFYKRNKAKGFAPFHNKSGWNDKSITGWRAERRQVQVNWTFLFRYKIQNLFFYFLNNNLKCSRTRTITSQAAVSKVIYELSSPFKNCFWYRNLLKPRQFVVHYFPSKQTSASFADMEVMWAPKERRILQTEMPLNPQRWT